MIYLPSYGSGLPLFCKKTGKRMGWWSDECFFKYPFFFTSAYYAMPAFKDMRKELGIPNDVLFVSDSGGFQILTRNITIDPYELIEWYNRNVDVGFILDYPPYVSPSKESSKDFDKRLMLTVKASKIMYEEKKESVALFACIHGTNTAQMSIWFDAMKLIADWDGYAFGVAPVNNPESLLRIFRFIIEKKIDTPVHFFETGSLLTYAMLCRFEKLYGHTVMTDSSSYSKSATNRWIATPFGKLINIGTERRSKVEKFMCRCPVCSSVSFSPAEDVDYLALHNLYIKILQYKALESICMDDKAIKDIFGEKSKYIYSVDAVFKKTWW